MKVKMLNGPFKCSEKILTLINTIYLQLLLKGLGSVANGDPVSIINTYLPGYRNMF